MDQQTAAHYNVPPGCILKLGDLIAIETPTQRVIVDNGPNGSPPADSGPAAPSRASFDYRIIDSIADEFDFKQVDVRVAASYGSVASIDAAYKSTKAWEAHERRVCAVLYYRVEYDWQRLDTSAAVALDTTASHRVTGVRKYADLRLVLSVDTRSAAQTTNVKAQIHAAFSNGLGSLDASCEAIASAQSRLQSYSYQVSIEVVGGDVGLPVRHLAQDEAGNREAGDNEGTVELTKNGVARLKAVWFTLATAWYTSVTSANAVVLEIEAQPVTRDLRQLTPHGDEIKDTLQTYYQCRRKLNQWTSIAQNNNLKFLSPKAEKALRADLKALGRRKDALAYYLRLLATAPKTTSFMQLRKDAARDGYRVADVADPLLPSYVEPSLENVTKDCSGRVGCFVACQIKGGHFNRVVLVDASPTPGAADGVFQSMVSSFSEMNEGFRVQVGVSFGNMEHTVVNGERVTCVCLGTEDTNPDRTSPQVTARLKAQHLAAELYYGSDLIAVVALQ